LYFTTGYQLIKFKLAMKTIDQLLKSAKPQVPELPADFSEKIMLRIEKEQVSILPATALRRLQKLKVMMGLGALFCAIILFSYNFYELRMNGSLELLYFGTQYLGDFLGYLPWDLILPSLLLAAFSTWMINKANFLKKGIAVTAIVTYLLTGVGGAAIAATGFNEQIEEGITRKEKDWPWIGMFHHHRAMEFIQHPNFKLGKVEEILNGTVKLITPNGESVTIRMPENVQVEEGQILRISGQGKQAVFTAQKVHICNPNRVMRYFGKMVGHQDMMEHMMNQNSCCSGNGMMKMMRGN